MQNAIGYIIDAILFIVIFGWILGISVLFAKGLDAMKEDAKGNGKKSGHDRNDPGDYDE